MTKAELEFLERVPYLLNEIVSRLNKGNQTLAKLVSMQTACDSECKYILKLTDLQFTMVYNAVCQLNMDIAAGTITDYESVENDALCEVENSMFKMMHDSLEDDDNE